MKKLKKLPLSSCEDYFNSEPTSILSENDMKSIYGGCDPGLCYFDGLAYLSTLYVGGTTHSCDYYVGSFSASFSGDFMYASDGSLLGITNAHTFQFASSYFTTQQLQNGTDIYNFLHQGSGDVVLTSMNITNDSGLTLTHAIVLQSQNPNGSYHAWDATANTFLDVLPSEINAQMLIGVCGKL